MAHHKSALKRIRQSKTRNEYNKVFKREMKLATREVEEATDYKAAQESLNKAYRIFDKAAIKGVLHKNNVARKKARLAKVVKALKK